MSRTTAFAGLLRSCVSRFKKSRSKSQKATFQAASREQPKKSVDTGLNLEQNHSLLSADNFQKKANTPQNLDETNKTNAYRQNRSKIELPDVETEIIELEKDGTKLSAIVLNQPMAKDWNTVLKCKSKIKKYTEGLHSVDFAIFRLEQSKKEALREGDAFAESQQITMQIEDIINSKTIQRVRAKLDDFGSQLAQLSEQKRTIVKKLAQAQRLSNISLSNLETIVHRLFENNGLLDDVATSNNSSVISQTHSNLPASPSYSLNACTARSLSISASENERRETQQKMWDLSEKVQSLEEKLNNWSDYRSERHRSFLQTLEAGETSDTQTVFDLVLLKECQATTRELIEAEEEYSKTEAHARNIGVFVDDGEKEEGFGDCDDDGYTISHEQEMMNSGYLGWIYGWMEETPEKDSEPDIVEWPESGLDEWNAQMVGIEDSVSVRDVAVSVGRRREKIDAYRKFCDSLKNSEN